MVLINDDIEKAFSTNLSHILQHNYDFKESGILNKENSASTKIESDFKISNNIDSFINDLKTKGKNEYNVQIPHLEDPDDYENMIIDWENLDYQVNPAAGNLPIKRLERKCQQLENFVHYFKTQIYENYKAKQANNKNLNDCLLTIVDFCSGGGHLGIILAYLYPDCIVKLVENKEESLDMAIKRINKLELKNCFIYKVKFIIVLKIVININ
jgi:hypothetical protein